MKNAEKGAALITVMFIFSLAAIIIMAMLSRQRLDIERTGNLLEQTQAYEYALGAEELARQVLANSAALTPDVDYGGQQWAQLRDAMPVERGTISIHIEDLQGRYNINNLAGGSPAAAAHLQNLFRILALPEEPGAALIERLYAVNLPGEYLHSTGSLRVAAGMTPEYFALAEPYMTALPENQVPLNVNTASDNVLKAYVTDEAVYNRLLNIRAHYGFITDKQLRVIGMNTQGMTVKSGYFLMTAETQVGRHSFRLASVIRRRMAGNGQPVLSVISRDMSRAY